MDYTPLNNHMREKNHMAMWSLWFLWFLRVEYSGNQLYKPLCAFLVFVDLVWFLCGSFCGFWSRVIVSILGIVAKDINVPFCTGNVTCCFCGSVVLRVHLPESMRVLLLFVDC